MFHSVIIASKGRPQVLGDTMTSLAGQDRTPDEIILSVSCNEDIEGLVLPGAIKLLFETTGLTAQRNSGIRALDPRSKLVSFFDDDVELASDYCTTLVKFAEANPNLVGIGGGVVRDGATRQEARDALQVARHDPRQPILHCDSLYGCNMTFRRDAMAAERFDERLSLYGWLEDLDFSRAVARHGPLAIVTNLFIAHLRSTSGRMDHRRFGFAQVMNPWYLWRKGCITQRELWMTHLLRGIGANFKKLPIHPRDRLLRLRGNLIALAMIARGRVEPEAIHDI